MLRNPYSLAGCVYVAMEYFEGETLTEWAARPGRTWLDKLAAVLAAGAGLAAAHVGRVVHRDFKPDNVLVGRDATVKVTDFGLARGPADLAPPKDLGCGCGAPEQAERALDLGTVVGTPLYMAPELLAGTPADARSDQFSFAASAWEILHGAPPFGGDDLHQLQGARSRDELCWPPPDHEVPRRVAEALARALRASPSRRYTSVQKLLDELAEAGRSP